MLPTCACRNVPPPSLQIIQNLSLDRYLHVLTEITYRGADFPIESATGQLPKFARCALQKFCLSLQIFQNLPLDSYLHVLTEIAPPVCRFSKIYHWTDTYMCLQKFPPGVQNFPNLPLDSYLSYQHVFAEITHYFQIFQNLLLDI